MRVDFSALQPRTEGSGDGTFIFSGDRTAGKTWRQFLVHYRLHHEKEGVGNENMVYVYRNGDLIFSAKPYRGPVGQADSTSTRPSALARYS